MTKLTTMIGAILIPGITHAHPEHLSGVDTGVPHYLTDPFHVGLISTGVFLVIAVSRYVAHTAEQSGSKSLSIVSIPHWARSKNQIAATPRVRNVRVASFRSSETWPGS
jgi:hypothetical protein